MRSARLAHGESVRWQTRRVNSMRIARVIAQCDCGIALRRANNYNMGYESCIDCIWDRGLGVGHSGGGIGSTDLRTDQRFFVGHKTHCYFPPY